MNEHVPNTEMLTDLLSRMENNELEYGVGQGFQLVPRICSSCNAPIASESRFTLGRLALKTCRLVEFRLRVDQEVVATLCWSCSSEAEKISIARQLDREWAL